MKITKITAHRVDLPLHEGSYKWSGGKSVSVFDSTVVRVDTDAGVSGFGEVCPLGPFYLPAYADGVRAGIAELGPHLLGQNPLQLDKLNRRMDAALKGHAYVKSGLDMACWDILDEVIDSIDVLLRGHADGAMDVVNIKISKFGGLTKARQARDLCVSMGVAMTLEDSWGGDIVTAAIAHLAHSTPPEFLFTATDFNSYVTVSIADGAPRRVNGRMAASTAPGLGVSPRMDVLGKPVIEVA